MTPLSTRRGSRDGRDRAAAAIHDGGGGDPAGHRTREEESRAGQRRATASVERPPSGLWLVYDWYHLNKLTATTFVIPMLFPAPGTVMISGQRSSSAIFMTLELMVAYRLQVD